MVERRWRSATIREGVVRSTTRAFLYALGEDDADMKRPHIGVIHTGGEMSPCNLALRDQAQHAKTGVYGAGGTPHECPVVSVSDGLSVAHSGMRFSLVFARVDCRQRRSDDAGSPMGRYCRPRRLRQEYAWYHDGHDPLQRAVRFPLRWRSASWPDGRSRRQHHRHI